jgi:hypothetical protein
MQHDRLLHFFWKRFNRIAQQRVVKVAENPLLRTLVSHVR